MLSKNIFQSCSLLFQHSHLRGSNNFRILARFIFWFQYSRRIQCQNFTEIRKNFLPWCPNISQMCTLRMSTLIKRRFKKTARYRHSWFGKKTLAMCTQKNSEERLNMREICKSVCLKVHIFKILPMSGRGQCAFKTQWWHCIIGGEVTFGKTKLGRTWAWQRLWKGNEISFWGYIRSKRKTRESMSLWVSWAGNLVRRNLGTVKVSDAILASLFTGKVCSQTSHVSISCSEI